MIITRKSQVTPLLEACLNSFENQDSVALIKQIDYQILSKKVKFPLLEFCAITLFESTPNHVQLDLCRKIGDLNREGGNVLIGKILQLRLEQNFESSLNEAVYHIAKGKEWYVSDLIGERVFGVALLTQPILCFPFLNQLTNHTSNWVVRSIGSGTHYAIKKGLDYNSSKDMFHILLKLSNTRDYQIKRGIGWAAKTCAKFHPQIIYDLEEKLKDDPSIGTWFKTKVKIGLARHAHAQL